jgi:hypothetical protein
MSRCRLWICAIALACAAGGASATTITQGRSLTPLLPARGAYFDSSKSGTGVAVDVGLDGFVFLLYEGYDQLGAPTWYLIQGDWSPATEAQRIATGVIGTLDQPLLYAADGQCITCDFTGPPTVTIAPYPVSVTWTTPRHLDLAIGDQSWHMDAVQYGVADNQLPAGTWQLTISWEISAGADPTGDGVAAHTQIAKVKPGIFFGTLPIPTNVVLDANADPAIALPPEGSAYYAIDQSIECTPGPARAGTYGAAFTDIFSAVKLSSAFANFPSGAVYLAPMLWYDAATRRGGLDVATYAMGIDTVSLALGPNNVHFDLYVEPDRIVGHGVVQGQNLNQVPAGYWAPDSVMLNLSMQRVPDDLVERSIYPCMLL